MPPKRKTKPGARSKNPNRGIAAKKKKHRPKAGKRRPKPQNLKTKDGHTLYVKFKNLGPMYDFWGDEFKRHFNLETLASALERHLRTRDRFITPSIQQKLGAPPLKSFTVELFQEGKFQLIFRVKALNVVGKSTTIGLVVAKNHKEYSEVAKKEHALLNILHDRVPKCVVEPMKGGYIFMPDRHRRKEHDREIYAYCTTWLGGYHELGIQKDLRLFINVAKPIPFTTAQTEALKRRMLEIILRTYDPVRRNCMAIPQLASGDFVVSKPTRTKKPQLMLIACRDMENRISPPQLIRRIIEAEWPWGKRVYRLMPSEPEEFVQALVNALGKEEAMTWLSSYKKAVTKGRMTEDERFSVYMMEQLNIP